MKILDRYILTTYLKTFISVFVILMLIFVLQTIWLYIKELAGKNLDLEVIFKFLIYFMPKLIPLVLPLTILLTSIMVFGSLAENYEFAAMKSSGISLQRAMYSLSIFIVGLGITTFFFANNVIPWAEFKSYNLRTNIAKMKPAMVLAKGQFNPVGDYNIKFDDSHGDRNQFLENVTIHIKGADNRSNTTVIRSKTGELASKEESNVIKLILKDGNYYNDIISNSPQNTINKPFLKSAFETYTINIDLSQLNAVDIDDQSQANRYNMLGVLDLQKSIDSLENQRNEKYSNFSKNIFDRTNIISNKIDIPVKGKTVDTTIAFNPLLKELDLDNQIQLVNLALKTVTSTENLITSRITQSNVTKKELNLHYISFYDKFVIGVACIILFFVGAPLGALIRKGGIGLPLVIAILLYLTYYFIGIFATNSSKGGNLNPIVASWFSTLIMLPLGIFLTHRATADKRLFEFETTKQFFNKLFNIKSKEVEDYSFMHSYKNDRLLDVIENYKALGHNEDTRYEAIKLLNKRGYSISQLKLQGLKINEKFETTQAIYKDYTDHKRYYIILYILGAIFLLAYFILKNNKLEFYGNASLQLSVIAFILYIVYYIKSILNSNAFYNHINTPESKAKYWFVIIGIPLTILPYFILSKRMQLDLKQNLLQSLY